MTVVDLGFHYWRAKDLWRDIHHYDIVSTTALSDVLNTRVHTPRPSEYIREKITIYTDTNAHRYQIIVW